MYSKFLLIPVIIFPLLCDNKVSANISNSQEFTSPEDVQDENNMVVLGIIMINIKRDSTWNMFQDKLFPMIDSLLYHSPNTNLHFVVITDQWTLGGNIIILNNTRILFSTRLSFILFSFRCIQINQECSGNVSDNEHH